MQYRCCLLKKFEPMSVKDKLLKGSSHTYAAHPGEFCIFNTFLINATLSLRHWFIFSTFLHFDFNLYLLTLLHFIFTFISSLQLFVFSKHFMFFHLSLSGQAVSGQ